MLINMEGVISVNIFDFRHHIINILCVQNVCVTERL